MAGFSDETLSPKNRLKFLCSYGGKILPRPSDGQLKYVGGETRVVAVPRSITFSELMKKISEVFNNSEVVLKYQLMPEDLDALVSVTCDEDLHHMLDEYDRSPSNGSGFPRLRVFLFPPPSTFPHLLDGPTTAAHHAALEQRYLDAVNGVARAPASINTGRPIFTLSSSSAGSSPTSTTEVNHESLGLSNGCGGDACRGIGGWDQGMQRVHSSPTLNSLGAPLCGHQKQQYSRMYGLYQGAGGGSGRSGGPQLGAARYPMYGWQVGLQPRTRPYYSPGGSRKANGGCVCCGHVDESCGPRSGDNYFGGPMKQIWE